MDQGLYVEVAQHSQKVWDAGAGLLPGDEAGVAVKPAIRWAGWGLECKAGAGQSELLR